MLKRLFILLFKLITEPQKTWTGLAEKQEENNTDFYKSYLYPVLGMIALLSFVGVLIDVQQFDLENALKEVIRQLVVYLGGFYLASFILSEFVMKRFKEEFDKLECERFVGYSSALIYVVAMISSLFSELFFLQLIVFYSIYMIWVGASSYLKIQEEQMVKFTVYATLIVMASPTIIGLIMRFLMPGLG